MTEVLGIIGGVQCAKWEGEHDKRSGVLFAANSQVESLCSSVIRFGSGPSLSATKLRGALEQRREQPFGYALTLKRLRNADFVNEHLRGFVWVNVVDAAGHAYDLPGVADCNRQVMPLITQELLCQLRLDWLIEDVRGDILQNRVFGGSEDSDVYHDGGLDDA